jgi:hypothetical protein
MEFPENLDQLDQMVLLVKKDQQVWKDHVVQEDFEVKEEHQVLMERMEHQGHSEKPDQQAM